MCDGRDQLGVTAFGTAPGLGAADADDEAAYGPLGVRAYVPGGDQDLTAAGQQEIALGLAEAGEDRRTDR